MPAAALGTVAAIERLRAGRDTSLTIEGISMEPLLRAGQQVHVEPCTLQALRRGDLVAFERDDRLILHRVLKIRRGTLTEKGDNAPAPSRVASTHVLGRARLVRRGGVGIVWLSAFHGAVHGRLDRFAERYPSTRLELVLRLFDAALRTWRRLVLKR